MKFENCAVVMTDSDTGKPYVRLLTDFEANLVLGQLQALDEGKLKCREIVPFILRTVNVSEEKAKRIISNRTRT